MADIQRSAVRLADWFGVLVALLCWLVLQAPAAEAAALTLSQAVDRALRFAPSVALAAAETDLADARMREQRASLYPTLSADFEYNQAPGLSEVKTDRGLSEGLLSLHYTVFDWGRRMARLRAARYRKEAASLGPRGVRARIVFDTKLAYFNLLRAGKKDEELIRSKRRLERYLATVETLRNSGRATVSDVLKVKSARDNAELVLAAEQADKRRDSVVLGSLIGEFDRADLELEALSGVPPEPKGDLAQNPALRAAERRVFAAKLQVRAAETERYPTVRFTLTSGFLGVDPPDTFNRHLGASYDAAVLMPLFSGGLIRAHIDQARAELSSATARAREMRYVLSRRLSVALLRYQRARDQLAILLRSLPTAEDGFALAWTRFLGGGNVTVLEVLDAYQQVERLRLARFDEDFRARQAAAEAALLYGQTQ